VSVAQVSSNLSKSSNAIDLYQGESKDLDLTVTQLADEAESNECVEVLVPVDLTGATLFFTVRKTAVSPTILIEKDSTNIIEIEIVSPETEGRAIIHLTSGDTVNLDAGSYVFDVWVELSSGKRSPVIEVSEFIVREAVKKW